MFTTTGTIRYSPKKLGDQASDNWWCVVDCDGEIGRYYRQFIPKFYRVTKPAWAEHISVARNEEPSNKSAWEKYAGKEITLLYRPEIEYSEINQWGYRYFWLPVECTELENLRVELGLSERPYFDFHLTIANARY